MNHLVVSEDFSFDSKLQPIVKQMIRNCYLKSCFHLPVETVSSENESLDLETPLDTSVLSVVPLFLSLTTKQMIRAMIAIMTAVITIIAIITIFRLNVFSGVIVSDSVLESGVGGLSRKHSSNKF